MPVTGEHCLTACVVLMRDADRVDDYYSFLWIL